MSAVVTCSPASGVFVKTDAYAARATLASFVATRRERIKLAVMRLPEPNGAAEMGAWPAAVRRRLVARTISR